jgi:hypothetical protein
MKSPRRQRPLTIPANGTFRLPASCNDLALRGIYTYENGVSHATRHGDDKQRLLASTIDGATPNDFHRGDQGLR